MKRLAFLLAVVATAVRADPYAGFYYPAGVRTGTTTRIVVGGQRFWGIKGGWVSGAGVEVVKIEKVKGFPVVNGKGQSQWLDKWMYAILDGRPERPPLDLKDEKDILSWTRHPWWENMNELQPLEFSMVARYLNTPRNPLQMSPSLSERLIITVTAASDAAPGVRDIVLYDDRGATAPHPFFVTDLPRVEEPLYRPPKRKGPPKSESIGLPVVLDGQIMPGETDVFRLDLSKGAVTFRLDGRELQPYLGDAVPGFFNPTMRLTDVRGNAIAFADDFHYLPDPVLAVEVPQDGEYRLEIRDNLYRGREDFVYSVTCTQKDAARTTPQMRAFACYPRPASHAPAAREGETVRQDVLDFPGAAVAYEFDVEKPSVWSFELFARRLGSPLDGVLRLSGPVGRDGRAPLLATWDDVTNVLFVGSVPQAECDPVGSWRLDRPGTYRVSVGDRVGAGGEDYRYELRFGPARPAFEVYASKSSFVLHRQDQSAARLRLKVVRRNGFAGPIALDSAADFMFRPKTIPANTNDLEVSCLPVRRDWTGVKRCSFTASATVGGRTLHAPIVPADETEQAFAYTHLLPARAFSFEMLEIYGELPKYPAWIDMPYDPFLPRKVLRSHAELSAKGSASVAGHDALAAVEIPIAPVPADFDEGVLAAKFASSAAAVRGRREVVAFEPTGRDTTAAAVRAALAGVTRFVKPDLAYADGDEKRMRILARAASEACDNDVLLYVPDEGPNPLAGPTGRAARALRDGGWCFDYATDFTLEKAPLAKKYRAVVVPALRQPLPEKSAALLEDLAKKRNCTVVRAETTPDERVKSLSACARREQLPDGVRFARYGNLWGEAWYLVHNVGVRPTEGPWRFNLRGAARHAVVFEIDTGRIVDLKERGKRSFAYRLKPGATAWIYVTARDFGR